MSAIKRFPAYLHDMQQEVEGYAKGYGLERLDQLVTELLLGIR